MGGEPADDAAVHHVPFARYHLAVPAPTPFLTKVLATVGPACDGVDAIGSLIDEGARVFRINFSHGDFDEHTQRLRAVREAAEQRGVPVGVLGDLRGPKLRLGPLAEDAVRVEPGDRVEFTGGERPGYREPQTGETILSVTYPPFVDEVEPGHRVLINDGAIRMLAVERVGRDGEGRLICSVTHGGEIEANKGVNLPDSDLSTPSLTDFDRECVAWAIEHEIDYLALSFVRRSSDVEELRGELRDRRDGVEGSDASRMFVVAKLETPQAIADLQAILNASDAVMVARGDLGVEMDLAEVPVIQKKIIEQAHDHGKPVIVATQMLQSMIKQSAPTRAEVSDVANAILDGADAVMLSGETAVGMQPSAAVHVMSHTAEITEAYAAERWGQKRRPPRNPRESRYRTAALAHGVSVVVRDLDARYVVMWSELGGGARLLSQNRLTVPILAVSSNPRALARMSLLFGVVPLHMPRPEDGDAFVGRIDELLQQRGWAEPGDPIVIAHGEPLGIPGVTNKIRIHHVGDLARLERHALEQSTPAR